MLDNHNITYIIPFKGSNSDRIRNLNFHLYFFYTILNNPFPCIIVEQDSFCKISECLKKYPKVKHIFFQTDKNFRKSVLVNCGVKFSNTKNILISDCDSIYLPIYIQKMLEEIKTHDAVFFKKCHYLKHSATKKLVEEKNLNILYNDYDSDIDKRRHTYCGGALTLITKESFWKIKGFDENFVGWGYEDSDFQNKSLKLLNYKILENPVWHLYHKKEEPQKRFVDHNYNLRNKQRELSIFELQKHLENIDQTKLGNRNFFDNVSV